MSTRARLMVFTLCLLAAGFTVRAGSAGEFEGARQRMRVALEQARHPAGARVARGPRTAPADAVGKYFGALADDTRGRGYLNLSVTSDGTVTGEILLLVERAYSTLSGTVVDDGTLTVSDSVLGVSLTAPITRSSGLVLFSGSGSDGGGTSFGFSASQVTAIDTSMLAASYSGSYKGGPSEGSQTETGTLALTLGSDLHGSGTVQPTGQSQAALLALGHFNGTISCISDLDQYFSLWVDSAKTFSGSWFVESSGSNGTASGKRSGGSQEQPAVNPFTASFTSSASEGFAPLAVDFDAGGTSEPNGKALTAYLWDFGDGSSQTTAGPTVSHTFATPGSFATSLVVENSQGEQSAPARQPIVVADGITTDGDLFASAALLGLNFSQHIHGVDADFLKIAGRINPAGLPNDLSTVLLTLTINGVPVGGPAAAGRTRSGARAGSAFLPLLQSDGSYSVSLKGVDLREVIPVANVTGTQEVGAKVELAFSGAVVDTPIVAGVVKASFKVGADKSAKGSYNFLTLGSPTGTFKSLKTSAVEQSSGGHKLLAGGPIAGELSTPLVPDGDLTLIIGGDGTGSGGQTILIPLASLARSGDGAKSIYTYSASLGEVPELVKFQLSNAKKKFLLATNELAGTGIPALGSAETSFDLSVVLQVPTANGVVSLRTSIELKRSAGSTKWAR